MSSCPTVLFLSPTGALHRVGDVPELKVELSVRSFINVSCLQHPLNCVSHLNAKAYGLPPDIFSQLTCIVWLADLRPPKSHVGCP